MRVSSYVSGAHVPDFDAVALLHGYRGDIVFVEPGLGARILEMRGQVIADGGVPADARARLEDVGILTPLDADDERDAVVKLSLNLRERNFATNPTAFMIVPSVTCNLRCPYCFQPHEMHKGKGRFGTLMTTEQLDLIFHYIDRLGAPGAVRAAALGRPLPPSGSAVPRENQITLFGGEPLCSETLGIVPEIIHRAQARGMTLSAITNGVELDLFEASLGKDSINHVQVTLDGLADKHDRRRVGPRHKKTFDKIVRNVDDVLRRGIAVSMRINVDTLNLANIEELDAYFDKIGWTDLPNFMPYAAAVDALSPKQKTRRVTHLEVYDRTEQLRETGGSRMSSYESYAEELVSDIFLRPDVFPFAKGSTCAAETGQLIFDPLGDIYSCWEDVGQTSLRVATYGTRGLVFEQASIESWLHRFPGSISQCAACPYALIHTSGCGAHARAENGDLHASACEGFQQLFPVSFARAIRKFHDRFKASPIAAIAS
jgi:uncharacterized protein